MTRPSRWPVHRARPRGQWTAALPRHLRLALLASVLTHVMLLSLALTVVRRSPLPVPTESSTIELVMRQQKGTEPRMPASPPLETAEHAPAPSSPPASPRANQPDQILPQAKDLPPPAPPQKDSRATATASETTPLVASDAPQARQQPTQNLDFTALDDYNAIAFGKNIVPAAPDSRARNNPPVYPHEAGLRGEHGTVVLLIHIAESGRTAGADVLQSSGYESLDNAALTAVRAWRFKPALHDGQAVPSDMPFRFVFEAR